MACQAWRRSKQCFPELPGPTAQDIAQIFNAAANVELPIGRGRTSPVSRLNKGQGNRPDRVSDGNLPPDERTLSRWYLQEQTYGNAGTNPLFSDGQTQLYGSIFKSFRIAEHSALQFRADFFNAFNHPDVSTPRASIGSSTNGRITATSIDGRRMQFGLRLSF